MNDAEGATQGTKSVGIDLGCKEVATCSNGTKVTGRRYRELEQKLGIAQRARNKQRVKAIHAKIANRRKDDLHKLQGVNILAGISAKQREVMKWLANKWSAQPSHGEVFTINGGAHRQGVTCSLRTLKALEKKGFTCVDGTGSWVSTELGRQFFREQPISGGV